MTQLLHLDASARPGRAGEHPHGSHTRALSHRFVSRWARARPGDALTYRDVGLRPPAPVSGDWVPAAFAPPAQRTPAQHAVLAESDALVDELLRADQSTQAEVNQKGIRNGYKTINEVRRKEGKPPVSGGDLPMVSKDLAPLEAVQSGTAQ